MFGIKDGFNIVIGNPPYIRQEMLDSDYKTKLKENYPKVFTGTADLLVYFFAVAHRYLCSNGTLALNAPTARLRLSPQTNGYAQATAKNFAIFSKQKRHLTQ